MKKTIYEVVEDGTYEEFIELYNQLDLDINITNEFTKINLLGYALLSQKNKEDKLKIIQFLLDNGIDVNQIQSKNKENALHLLIKATTQGTEYEFMFKEVKLLVTNGIDINYKNKFKAISLQNLLADYPGVRDPDKKYDIIEYLINKGADYRNENIKGISCLSIALEDKDERFLKIVEEYENANK